MKNDPFELHAESCTIMALEEEKPGVDSELGRFALSGRPHTPHTPTPLWMMGFRHAVPGERLCDMDQLRAEEIKGEYR